MTRQTPFITDLEYGTSAIDADYGRPLAAASHLVVEKNVAAFVDTGTNHSVPLLLEALERKGVARDAVVYVFLTHIHLDHAGGAGLLMRSLPNATCVVHPRGARHLVDPTRLVEGSIAVYGEETFRALYGDIVAIDVARIDVANDGTTYRLDGRTFEVFHTEGHARHHYCLHDPAARSVFTGDSFGVSYRELDTGNGPFIFPTTTPVHFDPDAAHEAIEAILARDPERLLLTHYSEVRDLERLANDLHECLDAFVALADSAAGEPDPVAALRERLFDYLNERLDRHGVAPDPQRRHAVLDMDCDLNAQGLIHWHRHGR